VAGLASLHGPSSNSEQAIALFHSALKVDSGSPEIHSGLAEAFSKKFTATNDARWLKEASAFARRAESLQPDSPPVLLVLGSIEQAEGRPERAIELFRRAAELEPNNADAWRRTGIAFQRIGRDSEAVGALRKAVQLAPGYYAPHLSLGSIYFRMGRSSEAVDEFRTVTQLAPELPDGYSYMGAALLATEQEREAEQALRQSLKLRESRPALNNLSVLLRYQRRDREAVEVLQRALQVGADDSMIRLNLGNALRRTGRLSESRQSFRKASDLARAALLRDPRDAAARARLAYSMVQLGVPAFAADEALQAARLTPSDYSVLFWSVMTLESLGRRQDAFPLLANASYERLRDLRRQPDLADFSRDPRFLDLLRQSQDLHSQQQRKSEGHKDATRN
jgi:Flp pilus assembly protein TadD